MNKTFQWMMLKDHQSPLSVEAAHLLEKEWPTRRKYKGRLVTLQKNIQASKKNTRQVPCAFVLTKADTSPIGSPSVVGFASLKGALTDAIVSSVVIDPEYRGQGVGQTLMNHVCGEASQRGFEFLYLSLAPKESLEGPVAQFYQCFGFRPTDPSESLSSKEKRRDRSLLGKFFSGLEMKFQKHPRNSSEAPTIWMRKSLGIKIK